MRHFHWTLLLLFWFGTVSFAAAQPAYYALNDFQWYTQYADGSKRRTELVSLLSRTRVAVGILWSSPTERTQKQQAVQAFLQELPTTLSTIAHVTPGPSSDTYASYLLTLRESRSFAGMVTLLNTMQSLETLDFALPVFGLSQGDAAPFPIFDVTFAVDAKPWTIDRFLQRQPVKVLQKNGKTYTLQVHRKTPTNILAVLRAFEDAPNLVAEVEPMWITMVASGTPSASAPTAPPPLIEAHVSLTTGWSLPLVNIREPITYRVEIEHDAKVKVLPDSIAPAALRRAVIRATNLPTELFDIAEAGSRTTTLANTRIREMRAYTLRLTKPGTYTLPTLRVSYIPPGTNPKPHTLTSTPARGHLLTVASHLPANLHTMPGDILAPPRVVRHLWAGTQSLVWGLLLSGICVLAVGLYSLKPRRRRERRQKPLSRRRLRRKYELALAQLRTHIPEAIGSLAPDERAWLRQCATLFRRLLGEWSCSDATHFEGAAGISAAMITEHLALEPHEEAQLLAPSLTQLQELDNIAAAPTYTLTSSDYARWCIAFEHLIRMLTTNEGRRLALRQPARI